MFDPISLFIIVICLCFLLFLCGVGSICIFILTGGIYSSIMLLLSFFTTSIGLIISIILSIVCMSFSFCVWFLLKAVYRRIILNPINIIKLKIYQNRRIRVAVEKYTRQARDWFDLPNPAERTD